MTTPEKRLRQGPTRRKVLVTALAAGAGVATARAIGVRNLGTTAARAMEPSVAMPAAQMGAAPDMDGSLAVADDAFFGEQNFDAALPRVALPTVDASDLATHAFAPPISGIEAPVLTSGIDWVSPLETEAARIAHLLRRTTIGYTDAELDRALGDGYAKTVERLVDTPAAEPPAYGQRTEMRSPRPSMTPPPITTRSPLSSAAPMSSPSPMPSATPVPTPAPPDNRVSIDIKRLQQWWVDWMLTTPTPFAEKMTLFWHGHFTSDYRKVGTDSPALYWQNQSWRRMALTDLRTMLLQVTTDLAMLRYLDLAASTGRAPNENYARELMELFTLGPGSYTEDDVRAAAKALAGWRLPNRDERTATAGIFDYKRAFVGPLTFLGKTNLYEMPDVIDQILAQDAAATHITSRVVAHFVSPYASDAYVARLADGFRRSKYDVKQLMRSILLSPEFVAPESYRALIKSPTEFMVSAAKAVGATSGISGTIVQTGAALGQVLFDPPSVGGWGDGASWISSNTMLQRTNFVSALVDRGRTIPSAATAHQRYLDGVLGPGTVQEVNAARSDRTRWSVVLSSPEFHLK